MKERVPTPSASSSILLAGASSEIGHVLARHLARDPRRRLLLTSRSGSCPTDLDRDRVDVMEGVDLTKPEHLARLAKAAADRFDGPFTLLHSVGEFWEHKRIDRCDVHEACTMFASHYLTLYGLLHFLLPLMAARRGGRVLTFSCTSVGFHYPEMAAFTNAKAAVECLIKCTANEWSRHGILANAIALSTIRTEHVMRTKILAQDENYVTPEELCVLVEDILSAESPYLSGNVVRPLKYSDTYYHKAYFERNPPSD